MAEMKNAVTMIPATKQVSLPESGRGSFRVEYQSKSIDQMIYEFMEAERIPGLTLAIVQAPYIPRIVGYGVADAATGRLASAKTIWAAGPVSQGFTAVAAMQLFERGKLDLHAPISRYLPELPKEWQNTTVFELMQHASGIPDYRRNVKFSLEKDYQPEQLIALADTEPPLFKTGTDVAQSATNFLLLAQIIEKASGQKYRQFVTANQIDFLGLKRTLFQEDFSKLRNEAISARQDKHVLFTKEIPYIDPAEPAAGTTAAAEGITQSYPLRSGMFKGFADIWASAEDISTWDIALAGSILIREPEHRQMIYQPTRLANGKTVPAMAGWQFMHHKGLMDIKGTVPGYSAFLSRFTDSSELVCVTLMSNKDHIDFTNLARRIASAFGSGMGSGMNEEFLYAQESIFSVAETVSRLESELVKRKIPVFAKFDHGANAKSVDMLLPPSVVVVFGAPSVGTKLMQLNPSIAVELPLRIAVWQDAAGSVWAAAPRIHESAARYGLQDNPVIQNMRKLLETLVARAANLY